MRREAANRVTRLLYNPTGGFRRGFQIKPHQVLFLTRGVSVADERKVHPREVAVFRLRTRHVHDQRGEVRVRGGGRCEVRRAFSDFAATDFPLPI
jgi:hypothetical protein